MNPQPVARLQIRHIRDRQRLSCAHHLHLHARPGQIKCRRSIRPHAARREKCHAHSRGQRHCQYAAHSPPPALDPQISFRIIFPIFITLKLPQ